MKRDPTPRGLLENWLRLARYWGSSEKQDDDERVRRRWRRFISALSPENQSLAEERFKALQTEAIRYRRHIDRALRED